MATTNGPPKTYVTKEQQDRIEEAFASVRDFAVRLRISRESRVVLDKLDEAKMWAFAHYRVAAGGSP